MNEEMNYKQWLKLKQELLMLHKSYLFLFHFLITGGVRSLCLDFTVLHVLLLYFIDGIR